MSSLHPKKVVLISGASSGIGYACATYLANKGYTVYGTSRQLEKVANPEKEWTMLSLDVRQNQSVVDCIQQILTKEGHLDAVVNNAGFGISGAIEDTSLEEAKDQFEVNFFGALRIIQNVLPTMRRQGQGTIINISSLGGLIGLPFQALYSASKFALEGLSEALYKEVRSAGIQIVLIEPGDFKTAFTANRRTTAKSQSDTSYKEAFSRALAIMEQDETQGDDPLKIARLVEQILTTTDPRLRYRVGAFTQKLAVSLKAVLPNRVFDWLIMNHYSID
ncbi:MAG: SDR family oxidoreductase [Fidelibacterota bacterium]